MPTFSTLPASYATVDDVLDLCTRIGSISTVTSAHVRRMIGMAQADVDAKLAKKYDLPFTSEVPFLTVLTANLAVYYSTRKHFTREKSNKSDWVDSYKIEAERLLQQLLENQVELIDTGGTVIDPSDSEGPSSNTEDYIPTFSELPFTEHEVDEDKLTDKRNEQTL